MKKGWMAAVLLMTTLSLPTGGAVEMPAWEYPIAPEILQDMGRYITLANRDVLLESSYIPDDLVDVKARSTVKCQLRKEANDALNDMFAAAEQDGFVLYVKSAYRSYQTQNTMYNNRLDKNHGRDDGMVAYPGASDHQTGLGVDILNYAWTQKDGMNKEFALTAEAKWMEAHCQEFGFVLRYMADKEDVTGIKFEPWNFRYVGKEVAAYMMENHLSLEEFTQEWQAYVQEFEEWGGDFNLLLRLRAQVNEVTVIDVTEDGEEELSIFYH